jgi:hypothetical protein
MPVVGYIDAGSPEPAAQLVSAFRGGLGEIIVFGTGSDPVQAREAVSSATISAAFSKTASAEC